MSLSFIPSSGLPACRLPAKTFGFVDRFLPVRAQRGRDWPRDAAPITEAQIFAEVTAQYRGLSPDDPRPLSDIQPVGPAASAAFLAARAMALHNPWAKKLIQRLRDNGKPYKVAMIALARRLIVILNAMVRDRGPWRQPA